MYTRSLYEILIRKPFSVLPLFIFSILDGRHIVAHIVYVYAYSWKTTSTDPASTTGGGGGGEEEKVAVAISLA